MSSKRRKIDAQLDGVNDSFPTPAATNQRRSQLPITEEDSESEEPVRSTQRTYSSRDRKTARQQRLNFSNVREADSFSPPMKLSSPSRPQSSTRAGMFGTQKKRTIVDVSSDEGSNVGANDNEKDIEVDSDEELPSPAKLVAPAKQTASKSAGRQTRATRSTQPIAVDSESEDEIIVSSKPATTLTIESDEEEENDDMPTTLGTQRRQRAKQKPKDDFIVSSPPELIESDSDLEILEPPKKSRHRKPSEDDADEPVTPRRLKRRRGTSQREKEDLAEDLDFLEPSSDVESPRKKRDTQSQKKNARQQALDKLKRRRSKQVDVPDDNDDDDGDGDQGSFDELYDDEDDYQQRQPPPLKSSQMFREDEWDQGFIEQEEDEDGPLGIPEGVPLEFTRYASMKPKELFKFAVEWFVQKKINPAFSKIGRAHV